MTLDQPAQPQPSEDVARLTDDEIARAHGAAAKWTLEDRHMSLPGEKVDWEVGPLFTRVLDRLTHLEGRGIPGEAQAKRLDELADEQQERSYHGATEHHRKIEEAYRDAAEEIWEAAPSLEGQHGEGADLRKARGFLRSIEEMAPYDGRQKDCKHWARLAGDLLDRALATTEAGQGGPTEFASQDAMRFGPRSYTAEQAEVIELAVRDRRPLPEPPLQAEAGQEEALARADELAYAARLLDDELARCGILSNGPAGRRDGLRKARVAYRAARNPTTKDTGT